MFSTPQIFLFFVLPSYLLVFSVGYLIARRNRGQAITTLGLTPRMFAPLSGASVEGFKSLLFLFGCLLLLPLLPVIALLSIPYMLIVAKFQTRREAMFAERIKLAGRIIRWSEAEERVGAKQGTLIRETFAMHGPSRFWWTPDDVAVISPFPFARMGDQNRHRMEEAFWAFGEWCRERYTNEASGSALLVEQPRTKPERLSFLREADEVGYIESYCKREAK